MSIFYYKHYVTFPPVESGESAIILDGFSTAFKQPQFWDVCINQKGGYQFKIMPDAEENSPLTDWNGCHLYRYENGQVREATEAELAAELTEIQVAQPPAEPTPIEELQAENKLLKAQLTAQADRQDFVEDCVAEMAMQLYA